MSDSSCPFGYKRSDLDRFVVSSEAACPAGFTYKYDESMINKKCPANYDPTYLNNFDISSESKCPFKYMLKNDVTSNKCPFSHIHENKQPLNGVTDKDK